MLYLNTSYSSWKGIQQSKSHWSNNSTPFETFLKGHVFGGISKGLIGLLHLLVVPINWNENPQISKTIKSM